MEPLYHLRQTKDGTWKAQLVESKAFLGEFPTKDMAHEASIAAWEIMSGKKIPNKYPFICQYNKLAEFLADSIPAQERPH